MHLVTGCSHRERGNGCILQSGAPTADGLCFTAWWAALALHTGHKPSSTNRDTLLYNTETPLWLYDNPSLQAFNLSDTSFFPPVNKHLNPGQLYKQSKSPSKSLPHTHTQTQTHARIKPNQFPARRCTVLNWHKFLSWQRSDDFLCLTPWKCYKEVWRGLISPLFSHTTPSLWCLLFMEKKNYNKTPKPKHVCDMESSDASILTAPSALSSLLFFPATRQ